MNTATVAHWLATAPAWEKATLAGTGLASAAVAGIVARSVVRRLKDRGANLADVITVLVALIATVYAGTGTWHYLSTAMGYGPGLRSVLVGVFEGAVIAEGLRSRKNIADHGRAGVDGVALWVLTCLSGALSASETTGAREALGRLIVPLVAAWLWERLLAPQRRALRAQRPASLVRWRITRERIAVWLRLADATDTDVSRIDASRRVVRYLRATDRESRGWRWPLSASARAHRARTRLAGHALIHSGDPADVHARLAAQMLGEALTRLGIDTASEQPGASQADGRVSHGSLAETAAAFGSLPLRVIDMAVLSQLDASLPLPDEDDEPVRHRVAAASAPARRQASVTARIGVDRDPVERLYRKSAESGEPLSSRTLASLAGVSQSTAARVIARVKAESAN